MPGKDLWVAGSLLSFSGSSLSPPAETLLFTPALWREGGPSVAPLWEAPEMGKSRWRPLPCSSGSHAEAAMGPFMKGRPRGALSCSLVLWAPLPTPHFPSGGKPHLGILQGMIGRGFSCPSPPNIPPLNSPPVLSLFSSSAPPVPQGATLPPLPPCGDDWEGYSWEKHRVRKVVEEHVSSVVVK